MSHTKSNFFANVLPPTETYRYEMYVHVQEKQDYISPGAPAPN